MVHVDEANKHVTSRGKSREKHDRILGAAMAVFLERGFEGASLDQIAIAANVSKQTIYNHFGDKASLFRAICLSLTEQVTAQLIPSARPHQDVKAGLARVGRVYLDLVLRTDALALHRIIISEVARFPDLGPAIYAEGAARATAALAAWLAAQGELVIDDAEAAAENFFALLKGNRQIRALLGVPCEDDEPSRASVVNQAVEMFLRAYAKPA